MKKHEETNLFLLKEKKMFHFDDFHLGCFDIYLIYE